MLGRRGPSCGQASHTLCTYYTYQCPPITADLVLSLLLLATATHCFPSLWFVPVYPSIPCSCCALAPRRCTRSTAYWRRCDARVRDIQTSCLQSVSKSAWITFQGLAKQNMCQITGMHTLCNFFETSRIRHSTICDHNNGNLNPLCCIPRHFTGSFLREFHRRSRQSQMAGFGMQHIHHNRIAAHERLLTAKRLVALALAITCTPQSQQQGW